jgi:hypothetical protein
MISYKTIKLLNNKITFTFYIDNITIDIDISNASKQLSRNHNEFNTILDELKNDFNIPNYKLKLIKYWFNKNYKKTFPNEEYITKFGRKIKVQDPHQFH